MSEPPKRRTGTPDAEVTEASGQEPGLNSFKPGDRVGRYVILSLLGQGGMSVVFLAYDPELDRKVALKLMRAGLLGTQGRSRLQREAQALARLSHPNVVPVYDVGQVDDQTFVAMEHIEGMTLKKWLKQPRTFRAVLALMVDAGRGLAAAHLAGLVHRDFKPDNVVIGNDGRVRVLDFGLARPVEDLSGSNPSERSPGVEEPSALPRGAHPDDATDSAARRHMRLSQVTRADQIIGTPAYMAPEQVMNGATDERADQFSFCVTLYEALYRARPFDATETLTGSAMPTLADKKRKGEKPRSFAAPPPRNQATAQVPRWVEPIVMRGLSLDPVDRYPSMDQLLQELSADPAAKRRRWLLAAGAIVMLGAGVLSANTLKQRERELCRGGAVKVARAWSGEKRDAVHQAFAALKLPYAEGAAQTFTRALDEYAASWTQMHQDACEATRLRGEQSEEVLDLRMACLSDRLKEVAALSEVMRHPDADAVQEASRAARTLTPVAECADIAALKGAQPRPRDPLLRKQIDELMRRLADVQAHYAVGKMTESLKLASALVEDATALGWTPLTAEASLWRGRSAAELGDDSRSIPAYRDAFAVALGAHSDRVMRQAAARLAQEYIYKNDLGEFHYWERVSQAAIDRTGPDPQLESFLQHTHCIALFQSGRLLERLDCLRKHAARAERIQPLGEWELTTLGLAASDAGSLEDSIGYLQRGVEFSTKQNGYAHPRTVEMRAYLCKGYLDRGQLDRALAECRGALETAHEVAPDNAYLASKIKLYLGGTLRLMKRYDEARALLEDVKRQVKPGSDALNELAQIASSQGRHAEAVAYFEKSLADDQKELGAEHPNLVTDLLLLGAAYLERGDLERAKAPLLRAHEIVKSANLNPFLVAEVEFSYARVLAAAEPARRDEAVKLAAQAREVYRAGPKTERFAAEVDRISAFLANPSKAAKPPQ